MMCRDLVGAQVLSIAGKGGPGKAGENGKAGAKECYYDEEILEVVCEIMPGENGGDCRAC